VLRRDELVQPVGEREQVGATARRERRGPRAGPLRHLQVRGDVVGRRIEVSADAGAYEPGAAYTSVELFLVGVVSVGFKTDRIARHDGWVVGPPSAQFAFT
jgi:hypothetical protein